MQQLLSINTTTHGLSITSCHTQINTRTHQPLQLLHLHQRIVHSSQYSKLNWSPRVTWTQVRVHWRTISSCKLTYLQKISRRLIPEVFLPDDKNMWRSHDGFLYNPDPFRRIRDSIEISGRETCKNMSSKQWLQFVLTVV